MFHVLPRNLKMNFHRANSYKNMFRVYYIKNHTIMFMLVTNRQNSSIFDIRTNKIEIIFRQNSNYVFVS